MEGRTRKKGREETGEEGDERIGRRRESKDDRMEGRKDKEKRKR